MYQINVVEEIKTHIFLVTFFPKIMSYLWDNAVKYSDVREAANDNMAARYMLD